MNTHYNKGILLHPQVSLYVTAVEEDTLLLITFLIYPRTTMMAKWDFFFGANIQLPQQEMMTLSGIQSIIRTGSTDIVNAP